MQGETEPDPGVRSSTDMQTGRPGARPHATHPVLVRESASYRTLVAQVRDYAIFAMDTQGHAVTWNQGVEAVLGYREDEFAGTPISAIFLPEDVAAGAPERELELALRDGVADNDRWQKRKDGSAFYASGRTTRLNDEHGRCIGFTKVLRDDTPRALTEERLRASELRYRAFIGNSTEGIWRFELDVPLDLSLPHEEQLMHVYRHARLAEANDAMARMYGYERAEDLTNLPLSSFLPPDEPGARAYMQLLVRSAFRVENVESVERDRDGRLCYFENSILPIIEHGKLVRAWGVQRDISERKKVQAALRESEQRRLVAIEAAGVGDWRMNVGSGLLECSPRARRMHRLEGEGPITIEEHDRLIHPLDRDAVRNARAAALDPAGKGEYRVEFRFTFGDGEVRWFESAGRAFFELRGDSQVPTHIVGAMIDITDRKRAEDKLREADRRKDEFLATLAHELRNPLAPLKNGIRIAMLSTPADSKLHQTIAMMGRQLNHLVRLVDDLLDVARISSGKIVLRKKPVAISKVLNQSTEVSRASIDARGHELLMEKYHDDPCVDGDFDRLTQVFANLLSNAAKYSEPGGRIRIGLRREAKQVVVTVTDTGLGIPAEDLPNIFDLFTQVRGHQGREEGGLGIGLSLVKRLVELHGGSIRAESAGAGSGSTFTVRLPLCFEAPAAEKGAAPQPPDEKAPALRVLIADDNEDSAASLAMLLGLEGHEVLTASDGVAALEKASEFRPDLVLLDLGMPRMGGLETARRLRALDAGSMTIVALTGFGLPADRQKTRDAGFDEHLVKPVDLDDLKTVITEHKRARQS